jgi:RES domain-containing protein
MGRRPLPTLRPWEGTAYRATTYDVPLWVRPNRRDGRWNKAGNGCTQYFCLDADAPYAEMIRHQQLKTEDEAATLRVWLWEVRLHGAAIVDYSTFELAEAAGFPADALVDDNHERCQHEAVWLQENRARGVLAPLAARPGSISLTLFGPRVEVTWDTTTQLSAEVPVRRIGGKGAPPTGLVADVRHFGKPHPTLEAFVAARVKRRQDARRRRPPSPPAVG